MTNRQIVEEFKMMAGIDADLELLSFLEWKKRGRSVKKGEKAIVTLELQKPYEKLLEDGKIEKRFFSKKTALFLISQTEEIKVK